MRRLMVGGVAQEVTETRAGRISCGTEPSEAVFQLAETTNAISNGDTRLMGPLQPLSPLGAVRRDAARPRDGQGIRENGEAGTQNP